MKRASLLAALALLLVAAAPEQGNPEQESEHTVKAGETLHGIANRAQVSREAIIAANRLEAPFTVRTGQVLAIPRTRRHRVVKGDTAFNLSWRYGVAWPDIAVANNLATDAVLRRGDTLLIPSVIPTRRDEPAAQPAAPSAAFPSASLSSSGARFAWPLSGTVRRSFAKPKPRPLLQP